ncbi:MAG: SUMF1/EgtB/PvdO family nonheme iron enzyme [Saprospiraceae bacterium]
MPAAASLPALRRDLLDLLTEDLAAALSALRDLLPEGTDRHAQTLAMQGRLKDANKERIRNTIAPDEYQRRVDTVRADCYDLISALEPADLEPPAAAPRADGRPAARTGSVLYRIPHRMPLQKPVICTIRVAVDEDAILEDIVLDDDVRMRPRVEVSDMMRAELLDPAAGAVFTIRPLSEGEQLVREQGYTQWLFRVTPMAAGEHQLLVKVSMMEYNPQLGRYVPHEVSVLETVTIVTGEAATDEGEMKATGERLALGPTAAGVTPPGDEILERFPPPAPPAGAAPPTKKSIDQDSAIMPQGMPQSVVEMPAPPLPRKSAPLRSVAFGLLFLIVGSAVTWAVTPLSTRDWWVASLSDSAESYTEYIREYSLNTGPTVRQRLEKAYWRKAEHTGELADLRAYLAAFPEGEKREQVLQKIDLLEVAALDRISQQPEVESVRAFLKTFPDSKRMEDVALAAKTRPEVWNAVQSELAPFLAERQHELELQGISDDKLPPPSPNEARDWAAAEMANTVLAYSDFVKKHPGSAKLSVARARMEALKPLPPPTKKPLTPLPDQPRSGLEMVPVKGGTFTMGCMDGRDRDCFNDEKPAHTVTLSGFQIGKYEVTQADWRSVMGSDPDELAFPGCDDCPVESVSWNDVQAFLKKLNAKHPGKNYRLPTEAEWEYAARGGHKAPQGASRMTIYAGGGNADKVAWYSNNSGGKTHSVGRKNPNELGLYDMSGNVNEWCSDWYEGYPKDAQQNPAGPITGSARVERGGSWGVSAARCRVSNRNDWLPGNRGDNLGIRIASTLK